jgi:hypothetical protein
MTPSKNPKYLLSKLLGHEENFASKERAELPMPNGKVYIEYTLLDY